MVHQTPNGTGRGDIKWDHGLFQGKNAAKKGTSKSQACCRQQSSFHTMPVVSLAARCATSKNDEKIQEKTHLKKKEIKCKANRSALESTCATNWWGWESILGERHSLLSNSYTLPRTLGRCLRWSRCLFGLSRSGCPQFTSQPLPHPVSHGPSCTTSQLTAHPTCRGTAFCFLKQLRLKRAAL